MKFVGFFLVKGAAFWVGEGVSGHISPLRASHARSRAPVFVKMDQAYRPLILGSCSGHAGLSNDAY